VGGTEENATVEKSKTAPFAESAKDAGPITLSPNLSATRRGILRPSFTSPRPARLRRRGLQQRGHT